MSVGPADSMPPDECLTKVDVALVRTDVHGSRAFLRETYEIGLLTEAHQLDVRVLSDYDRDGEEEILVGRVQQISEVPRTETNVVLKVAGDKLVPYLPATALEVRGAVDVNGDGAFDLVTSGPYKDIRFRSSLEQEGTVYVDLFVALAMPDGSFRTGAPAATEFTRAACANYRSLQLSRAELVQPEASSVAAIVCARSRGKTREEVVVSLDAACAAPEAGDEQCGAWAYALARVEPPVRF